MRHLFTSLCMVTTDKGQKIKGGRRQEWVMVEEMFDPYINKVGHILCRLDLSFMRPGKDEAKVNESGASPDRFGVMFCSPTPDLRIGHRIKCVAGTITGSFDIRSIDQVQGYSSVNHFEVGIVEVGQLVKDHVAVALPDPPRIYGK